MIDALGELRAAQPLAVVPLALALFLFLVNGARLAWIDARTHLLPNRIVFPWYPAAFLLLGTAAAAAGDWGALLRLTLAGVALFAFYLVLHLIQPNGMGLGDVKLAGILGMYLGYLSWEHLLLATLVTFVLGGVFGVLMIAARRATRKSSIPFGPFMILGSGAALLVAG
ncbi:prepilin peptidase [Arthrobacter halodurans]|uniref:Prepilin peptidase n=1 Tax=Arthrobacter halodurans TaxID=516699 RepID=A0ABV4URC5_9MICC